MKLHLIKAAAIAALSPIAFAVSTSAGGPVWDDNKVEPVPQKMGSGTIALIPSDVEEKASK